MNIRDIIQLFNSKKKPLKRVLIDNNTEFNFSGKICSFTGHRPQKLPFDNENNDECRKIKSLISESIITAINYYECTNFITGMALGTDIWAAEEVLSLQEKYDINLYAALPCETQNEKWMDYQKDRYDDILLQCEQVYLISREYSINCMQKRNQFLVNCADLMIAVYDGKKGGTEQTINMAKRKNIDIITINPNTKKVEIVEKVMKTDKSDSFKEE